MISLPQGVHRVVRASGRVAYYWRPGRGTPYERDFKHQWRRLPDDPQSSQFYQAIERLQKHGTSGGVDALVREFLASSAYEQLASESQRAYRVYLKQFAERLGHADPRDIKAKHIAALRESVAKERPGAAAAMVRVIKRLYSWATEMGMVEHNPMRDVSNRYKPNPREPWSDEAIAAISDMEGPAKAACLLALYTGQRISDICAMTAEHVEDGRISVVQQKTGKALKIRLHRELLPVVAGATGHLVSVDGRKLHPGSVRRVVQRECERLGLDGLHFHGLRKSAVCMLLEAGCTEAEAAAVTGQSRQMVQYYALQVNQEKLADAAIGKVER